ncbi:oligomerization domain protein [Neorickettsia helminthoeca str. Oregon]|uniref:Ribosomal silencing factor RsfS n=1 Tax=Neorickettsia helminthoeca str. Oregon TaxID=1286528 RepID=X5HL15_9RICK|nr:ribosome silencing factor [Neorickettsia helminthoeca]AHX11794.1 oligomerization domain protein [Neorickettsia helminthoeca str. Oregon]
MESEIVSLILEKLSKHKGDDIKVYGGRGMTGCMIVASSESHKQVKVLANFIVDLIREHGFFCKLEGYDSANWILIDMGEVMVHLFKNDVREYYEVDKLWS